MPEGNGNPMDSMMEIFMVETQDFLSKLEDLLIQGENAENGMLDNTPEIFRIMHTIKSSSAMMSLNNISKLSHKVEDLFYYLREHRPANVDNSKLTDIVLEAVDFIKRNIDGQLKEDPGEQIARAEAYLEVLKSGKAEPEPQTPEVPAAPAASEEKPQAIDLDKNKTFTIFFLRDCQMVGLRAFELINRLKKSVELIEYLPEDPTKEEDQLRNNGLFIMVKTDRTDEDLRTEIMKSPFVGRVAFSADTPPVVGAAPKKAPGEEPVRQFVERRRDSLSFGKSFANVEIHKLDNLVDLVGELLISQMELKRIIETKDFSNGANAIENLKKLILNLQEATLSTRMVPVRETFLKMNRLVRDMCRKQNKDIRFVTTGEDTEVDRSIIENLSSPLMHMIRNSIDHAIESAEERVMAGKPPQGVIELNAYTEGRNVVITVTDDGRGFNTEGIRKKAVSVGMITEAEASGMNDEDIHALVFAPGFSTNKEVTEYSGRGVGMDVVNENMRQMNGKVQVISESGKGSCIMLKIPLTLAIIDTIILRVGEELCSIPVSFVDKILYLGDDNPVRNVNDDDVVLLDGECYKILNLFDFYTYAPRIPYRDGVMLIVGGERRKYIVFASEILDRQDVVVKPAPPLFKTIRGISGLTILGDGQISLILDTDELMKTLNQKRSSSKWAN